ncbi:hypothetical protein LSH36_112g03068, partial [Paralvinella palmiformis]
EADNNVAGIRDQRVWSIQECANNLHNALDSLKGQLLKQGDGGVLVWDKVYLNRQPNPRKKLLLPCTLDKPNPKCYVCSEKPQVTVRLNTEMVTVKSLEDNVCI